MTDDPDIATPDQTAGVRGLAAGVMLSSLLWIGIVRFASWIMS